MNLKVNMKKWNVNNWKKNLMATAVLLVVCAGIYTNWMYTNAQDVDDLTDVLDAEKVMSENGILLGNGNNTSLEEETDTVSSYFAAVRLSRQQARDSALEILQEAMAYGDGSNNDESSAKLEEIVQSALCEAQIESLIIAKGYRDCVAYMSEDGISVAVASPEGGMQQADVALIADIVMSQTDFGFEDIHVVDVQ